jgi:hypothetical protein
MVTSSRVLLVVIALVAAYATLVLLAAVSLTQKAPHHEQTRTTITR